jgi:hypothetical protein
MTPWKEKKKLAKNAQKSQKKLSHEKGPKIGKNWFKRFESVLLPHKAHFLTILYNIFSFPSPKPKKGTPIPFA